MIFKQGSCEEELIEEMEKAQLDAVAKEEQHQELLILRAMEELNAAAESFERTGRKVRAKEVTAVMMTLANDKEKKELKKNDKNSEVKKVFMFFGFGPEDLEGLDLSSDGDTGDGD